MGSKKEEITFDYVIIGSGFGGSVSAMRLAEKGYKVLVLERGKRYEDEDFAISNWNLRKYIWAPFIRCFGILQISILKGLMVLHGSGVGGGSLGYANVLEVPDDNLFAAPEWSDLADWKTVLMPHYRVAQTMLGVTTNPCLFEADSYLKEIFTDMGQGHTFRTTQVGIFFNHSEDEVPDPYFGGQGPSRRGCTFCGACMVGCRNNSKNTLVKNYLYFAETKGAQIQPESEAIDIKPLVQGQNDGAKYEVVYRNSLAWLPQVSRHIRTRNVVIATGVLDTMKLLLRCRDVTRSLSSISPRLGNVIRTNSEALLGSVSRNNKIDYSKGIAITSICHADDVSRIEPVRYPDGSSFMRLISGPLMESDQNIIEFIYKFILFVLLHPMDFLRSYILPGWAARTTILLVMQTTNNYMKLRLGRSFLTFFRRSLVAENSIVPSRISVGHQVTRKFADKTNGIPLGSIGETLFNVPTTAHILGGCPFGRDASKGVIGLDCQVHNYPGLYVIDGSIVPANPGVNPSLTITALAEYAMSQIPMAGSEFRIGRK